MSPNSPAMPQRLRTHVRPTMALGWWCLAVAALGAVGWVKTINLVLLLAYVLVVMIVVNLIVAWRSVIRVSVKRQQNPPAFAREATNVTLEVTNLSQRPAVVSIHEVVGKTQLAWFMPHLPPGITFPVTASVSFDRRGRYRIPPTQAISGFPIGVVNWIRELHPASELLVLPPLGGINIEHLRRWLLRAGAGDVRTRQPAMRACPTEGDVRGLRPYRRGDSRRDVHWKTSARRRQLLVREYDQNSPLDLTIILDPWVPALPADAVVQARLEWALSLALSVAWAWVHAELPGRISLMIPGETPWVKSGPGTPGFVRHAFAPLADLTGSAVLPSLPEAAFRQTQASLRWVVSTRSHSPIVASLKRLRIPVAVSDPNLRPIWYTPPLGLELPPRSGT